MAFLTVNRKLDDLCVVEPFLLSGRFEDLLSTSLRVIGPLGACESSSPSLLVAVSGSEVCMALSLHGRWKAC